LILLNDFNTSVEKALTEIDKNWRNYNGLVICGTHTPHNVEEMIESIRIARELKVPFLGICFGHQLAAIEYARNIMGIKDATSEEFGKGTYVVKKLPRMKIGLHDGESYWNNYEVVIEPPKQEGFFTTQAHPEYQSSISKPHPLLVNFIEYAKRNKRISEGNA